ncbi:type IV secretory system conjugative DNA transfer family protein [Sphingomonas sp. LK11]|uniref:type IV secretory system conjugative DNA transfer family protein n=1 Tax=Sphingomonas sp. LK11 TaxID=1390395 RepID=UPI001F0088EB|nr:type IV secretory system conjugative DNA transfer family protein [Sphingomonas sp. LK11]
MTARHLLTMAPTRSGKGVGTIIPNLLLADRSIICVDPKGENARVTARARAARGRVWVPRSVRRLGPAPCRYNPLDRLDPGSLDLAEDANTLADALVHDAPGQAGEAHWNEEAKALIAGLVLHVVTTEPADRRVLATVREHLTLPLPASPRCWRRWRTARPPAAWSRAPPTASSASPTAKPPACCPRPSGIPTFSIARASSPARPRPILRSPI